MKVVRKEVYDYSVELVESDFVDLREVTEWLKCSTENAFIAIYLRGLLAMQTEFQEKE